MRTFLLVLFIAFSTLNINAQELNATVSINSNKISGSNKQVFATLQKTITEFVNQNKWSNKSFKPQERINCVFNITINAQPSTNRFEASIQVQSSRPIYNSIYASPLLNIKDNDFNFRYTEFEALQYNTNAFESNLVSTLVYYIYMIMGVDADTFTLNGGDAHYKKAKDVVLLAQQSGGSGWVDQFGQQNRYVLLENFSSPKYSAFKLILYNYHRQGMDIFSKDAFNAKRIIENSLIQMETLQNLSAGNSLLRLFFDAKADEISMIFSGGPRSPSANALQQVLQRISPTNTNKWQKIK
jgi:hypothetical protein